MKTYADVKKGDYLYYVSYSKGISLRHAKVTKIRKNIRSVTFYVNYDYDPDYDVHFRIKNEYLDKITDTWDDDLRYLYSDLSLILKHVWGIDIDVQ